MQATQDLRPFQNGMRSPIVAPVTRGLIAIPLFFLATHTDKYFAWTIQPPLTAAVLGANYLSSTLLALLASRKTLWATGRVSISVALAFAPITTAATFIHLNKFHLHTFYGWFWVIAYGIYPTLLVYLLWKQLKMPGGDPPRGKPFPIWVKLIFGAHAVLLIPLALLMFIHPASMLTVWPWKLTPLTSRALSAWVMAFGVLGAHLFYENDHTRGRVALLTYPAFGLLQVIALVRYGSAMRWGSTSALALLVFIASIFILGLFGFIAGRDAPTEADLVNVSAGEG
ncbi:MAG: hypothetical protein ABR507_02490 [Actinomycetota bacterium]|nr:hypothetical protein [Actinomycetota bacterium]